jgi:hypothetical protein
MIDWNGILAIIMCSAWLIITWKMNRYFQKSGRVIFLFGRISRDRTPAFFCVTMFMYWVVFGITALCSIALFAALAASWTL